MEENKTLHICHLYYDILNLYGDNGNIITLQKRLEWRGIQSVITRVSFGEMDQEVDYDMIVIGGGQDFDHERLAADLFAYKADWLKKEIEKGTVILAVGAGYQLLGNYFEYADGTKRNFLGGMDVYTKESNKKMMGNLVFDYTKKDGTTCTAVGFENHSVQTFLGEGVKPLGRVIKGFGNNGEDGSEGARYQNVFASYSHGPLLPLNIEITDELLEIAYERKYKQKLPELEHRMEDEALNDVQKQLGC